MSKNFLKKLLVAGFLALIFAFPAWAAFQAPAAPSSYVFDQANVLSDATESQLNMQLALLEQQTSTQIAVATITDTQGYPIEEASLEIARSWGIGQTENDNGVLMLIVPSQREARIEVGYGLEGAITDLQSDAILDDMFTYFADGDFDAGVISGVDYLEKLARGEEFTLSTSGASENSWVDIVASLIFFIGTFFVWMAHSKSWWLGGVFGGIAGLIMLSWPGLLAGIPIGLAIDFYLSRKFADKWKLDEGKKGKWHIGGPFGGFGGGSSGGGFGGFGGGGFGGGGASGRW